MKPITIEIDVTLLKKEWFKRKVGKDGRNKVLVKLVGWEKRQPGQYGDTHFIKQSVPKEFKDQVDERNDVPIIGNMSIPSGDHGSQRGTRSSPPPRQPVQSLDSHPDEDCPF